ncbi:MAG TPA: PilZ domain-containing protein [Terriglobales bacterium]|nr:PilZ domain-containing protein [Terriglobales bacterium]
MPVHAIDENRRRHRRLACGGEAQISLLPSDGALYLGQLKNLSEGGLCVEMPCPLEVGSRAELLVRINGLTFRTVGQVRTLERSRTGMEFVHLTSSGREMLEEFLENLETKLKAMAALRSGQIKSEADLERELDSAGMRTALLNTRIRPISGSDEREAAKEKNFKPAEAEKLVEPVEAIMRVDVFG